MRGLRYSGNARMPPTFECVTFALYVRIASLSIVLHDEERSAAGYEQPDGLCVEEDVHAPMTNVGASRANAIVDHLMPQTYLDHLTFLRGRPYRQRCVTRLWSEGEGDFKVRLCIVPGSAY
jgi:hypothetical protein